MSEKTIRKFRQINVGKGAHKYLAKEVHFVEVEPGKIKSVIIFDDDTRTDGPTVDEKIYKLNMEGFDIVSTNKNGEQKKSRHVGMMESMCFEEIRENVASVEVSISVEEPTEQIAEQKSA